MDILNNYFPPEIVTIIKGFVERKMQLSKINQYCDHHQNHNVEILHKITDDCCMCCNNSTVGMHQQFLKGFAAKYHLDNNKIDNMSDKDAFNLGSKLNQIELYSGAINMQYSS